MKAILYLLALITMLLTLNSCFFPSEPSYPPVEPWLCSINADGTGFRKIKKAPFNTPGLVDIYMTKDNRIIFYGDKLWISDTDVINPVLIVPDSLIMDNHPRISESINGNRLFFAANNSIYQLTYPLFELTKLSSALGKKLINPILSADDKSLTFLTYRQMKGQRDYSMTVSYLSLEDLITHELPVLGQYCHNVAYRMSDSRLYYNDLYELKSCSKAGDNVQVIGNYPSNTSHLFGFTHDERYLLVQGTKLRIIDLNNNSIAELSGLTNQNLDFVCTLVKTANLIYYIDLDNKLKKYDMNTKADLAIPIDYSKVAFGFDTFITANCDGSTLYFTCGVVAGSKFEKEGL